MNSYDDDVRRTEELLARALSEEAAEVDPRPGALQQIQRRTARTSRSRTPWLMGALGAAVATAAVITAVVVIGDTNDAASNGTPAATQPTSPADTAPATEQQPSPTPTSPSPSSTSSPSAPQTVESTETVYYVGQGTYLFSEPHAMTVFDGKRAEAAVTEFLSFGPLDPDYARGWPDGLKLDSITTERDATTISLRGRVDLADANGLNRRAAEVAIQAMIRTAQVESGIVSFVYNGEPVTTLLGVDVSEPVTREPDQGVDFTPLRAPLSIDSLVEGWSVSSPVTVTVSGNVFEGNVNWELVRDGRVLDEGYVTTAFTVWREADAKLGRLEPGTYTFTAFEVSMEDGSRLNVDDKTFTVS